MQILAHPLKVYQMAYYDTSFLGFVRRLVTTHLRLRFINLLIDLYITLIICTFVE